MGSSTQDLMDQDHGVSTPQHEEIVSSESTTTTATPFPFFKLPAKVRTMIYKYHIQQAADHPQHACALPEKCQSDKLGSGCIYARYNHGVDIGGLLTTCQRIYHEAEPIFEAFQNARFFSLERLRDGLMRLGPERRRNITRLTFDYTSDSFARRNTSDSTQAFKLLYESTELEQLTMWVCGSQLYKNQGFMDGLDNLLQIRGVTNLEVHVPRSINSLAPGPHRRSMWGQVIRPAARRFERWIAVLREPYDEEALQRRAAAGIVKDRGWRVFSLPCKNLIVEEITTISDANEDGA